MMRLFAAQVINYMLEMSLTSGGRNKGVAACSDQIQNAANRNTHFTPLLEFRAYKHFRLILFVFNGIRGSKLLPGKPEISLY